MGRIFIQDIELFPEFFNVLLMAIGDQHNQYDAKRFLAKQDMEILFVLFWTDTKNGFPGVQRYLQARAIENECYVAIGGSVENLPQVENVKIQYAQSAVYSPSDFSFPNND